MSDKIKLSPKHGLNATIPICFWCGKEKEEIALMGKIDKQDSMAPKHVVLNYEPCNKCKELFSKGIQVIGTVEESYVENQFPMVENDEVKLYPTGSMFVASEDWLDRFLKANNKEDLFDSVKERKVLLLPDEIVSSIIKQSNELESENNKQGEDHEDN